MKIFGFDLTFAYECICDVYNLLSAYKTMQDKKIKRLKTRIKEDDEEDGIEDVEIEDTEIDNDLGV